MLHLIGISRGFTSQNAHYGANTSGSLVRLAHGVYCDEEDLEDLPMFMRKSALRIANYLFPKTTLTHSSAYFSGAVESSQSRPNRMHHELFLGSTYTRTIRLQYLDIVLSKSMKNNLLHQFCLPMEDHQERDYGPLRISCASEELVFLQNFGRKRYNTDRFLDGIAMLELRERLQQKHGDRLVHRLKGIAATSCDFQEELDRALVYLSTSTRRPVVHDEINTIFEVTVGWYGRAVGKISMNGVVWDMGYANDWKLPLACQDNAPGRMPPFVHNMFPEGHQMAALQNALRASDQNASTVFSRSERYLSNIAIVENPERLLEIPLDVLHGRLAENSSAMGVFQGRLMDMPELHPRMSAELDAVTANPATPRISGNQAKLPCFLNDSGHLMPAVNQPFTHILKFPGFARDTRNVRGAMEWLGMAMARGAGLNTSDFALVDLDNGTLGCLVERFDIPRDMQDHRMIFCEDFCSAAGLSPQSKMMIENGLEDVIDLYNCICVPNENDAGQMLRLIYVNYLAENGDFHLKNAAVLRVADPTLLEFRSTRLSPAFDIMNTRYFSDFGMRDDHRETMVLDYKGKSLFTMEHLVEMGQLLGLSAERSHAILRDTAHGMAAAAQSIADNLPGLFEFYPQIKALMFDAMARAAHYCRLDFPTVPRFVHPEMPDAPVSDTIPRLMLPPAPPSPAGGTNTLSNLLAFDPMMLMDLESCAPPELLVKLRARL